MHDDERPPPWWFVAMLFGGMAGAVALAFAVVAATG
jgi:hypothetical protein